MPVNTFLLRVEKHLRELKKNDNYRVNDEIKSATTALNSERNELNFGNYILAHLFLLRSCYKSREVFFEKAEGFLSAYDKSYVSECLDTTMKNNKKQFKTKESK